MGTPDDVTVDGRYFQVKCWDNTCASYAWGDEVPDTLPVLTYSVALREGGFLNVYNLRIVSWGEQPSYNVVFDKWGESLTTESVGLLGEPYLFPEAAPTDR